MENFEPKIRSSPESSAERKFEVMPTPEIAVQEERGAQLFSLLLKAENPEWGETETPLAQEVTDYFEEHPVPSDILDAIRSFHEQGADEETLYNLALTYQRPERADHVLAMAAKYKPHVANPEEAHRRFLEVLGAFDQFFSDSPLAEKIEAEVEKDRSLRMERMEETRARIEALIDFYKPDAETSDIKRVSFVPTDPLYRKNSGRAFSAFPGEQIIISHIDNVDNQNHEFSHGIINPIVEKLSEQLTDEQKTRVSELASGKLKQDYGEGHFSLLCEEFIRTYNDVLKKGEQPQTYYDFMHKVSELTEDQFQEFMTESENLKNRFAELGIQTLDDFKDKSREYFERFEQNQLRDLIFELYQDYLNRPDKEGENFEQFVLTKFFDRLSE
jgi:hypothetical protein